MAGDTLFLYMSDSHVIVSSILLKEKTKGKVLAYFVSKVFTLVELTYLEVEKYLYALVVLARNLRPYFHAHGIKDLNIKALKHFL